MKQSVLVGLCVLASFSVRAQSAEAEVTRLMAMIHSSQADVVKGEIPGLMTRFPNHPGVLYLQGLTTAEGSEAVRIYQSIVDNFPASEWADDALYKVYQFYYSLGLYRTAELKMAQLRKNYPNSKYLTGPAEADTKQMPEEKAETEIVPAPTPAPAAKFTLQVGAFTAAANAEKQKSFFENLGYPVEVINRVKEGRSLFLVLVGTFSNADEARMKGAEIKKAHNVDSMVTTK